MKSYFQRICKILVSIFNYFFSEDINNYERTALELLISASVCDEVDFVVKQSRNNNKSCKDLTGQSVIQEKEQILHHAPPIPDIKKQFKIWSANMKEYDAIRKRIVNKSPAWLQIETALLVDDMH